MRVPSVLAALSAALLPVVFPQGAAADPVGINRVQTFSGTVCPAHSLCLYNDINFSGGGMALQLHDGVQNLDDYQFNDRMSAWANGSGTICYWYGDAYWQGPSRQIPVHTVHNATWWENDTASSVRC
ncbi:peptidase inhibitor family I36 protein [Streptomyces clavuligerus]|uniref:Peptidase inhibitor family I36 n=1 Tax=Streptomyces clavuligerus TaxID=1901 RepID=D5SLG4_STRCL|nr:peptidase inhibitor family I36 protein [Streptomyces clavuligerus]EFG04757.1 Hypothetical protein SCLAV_p1271 [Streptomyces clavuligerus]MBY6306794.1 peptidase inhibitor family I36 protein [Streptomyces clavuligerus]QCS10604.1 hypothetical protein CRV15_34310 [Streptomyces clavuligerus]QPJ97359.1 hypothetical protein GE265_30165 [Streptomyces clavuligerus]WDN57313.1 peptidase inhibitor family I36 protein [Streptomyces clavuligerus]